FPQGPKPIIVLLFMSEPFETQDKLKLRPLKSNYSAARLKPCPPKASCETAATHILRPVVRCARRSLRFTGARALFSAPEPEPSRRWTLTCPGPWPYRDCSRML